MHAHFAVVYLQVPLRICLSERVQPRQLVQIAQNITYALQPEIGAVAAGKGSSNHKKKQLHRRMETAFSYQGVFPEAFFVN